MSNKAHGYAILVSGNIDVRTVSPTEKAAKVNYLVAFCNVMVWNDDTDELIESQWKKYGQEAECVKVNIEVVE